MAPLFFVSCPISGSLQILRFMLAPTFNPHSIPNTWYLCVSFAPMCICMYDSMENNSSYSPDFIKGYLALAQQLGGINALTPSQDCVESMFFPTLAVGLLDFNVAFVPARLEADFSDRPPSIPAVPNRKVCLQCPAAEYPAVPNHHVSLHAEYPYTAQPQSIPALLNH